MTQIIPVRTITVAIPAAQQTPAPQAGPAVPDCKFASRLAQVRAVAAEIDPGRPAGSQTLAHHAACAIRHLCDGIEDLAADPGREAARENLRRAVRKIAVAARYADCVDPEQALLAWTRGWHLGWSIDRITANLPLGEMAGQPWRANAAHPALNALGCMIGALTMAGGGLSGADARLIDAGLHARTASVRALHRLAPGQQITPRMRYRVQG